MLIPLEAGRKARVVEDVGHLQCFVMIFEQRKEGFAHRMTIGIFVPFATALGIAHSTDLQRNGQRVVATGESGAIDVVERTDSEA
jgi:predicted HAD superfamily phosphohydrolase